MSEAGAMTPMGRSSTQANPVRSESCRRTTSARLRASADAFRGPCSR